MIYINAAPEKDQIILNGNESIISVSSTRGKGFYFLAEIKLGDVVYDIQQWSRKDSHTSEKNIKNMFKHQFKHIFEDLQKSEIKLETDKLLKVSIVIKEYDLDKNILHDSIKLPDFFILYSDFPAFFDDKKKIQLLGVLSEVLVISSTGKISIPFLVNGNDETMKVSLISEDKTVLDSHLIKNIKGKNIFSYRNIIDSNYSKFNFVELNLEIDGFIISKKIKFLKSSYYDINEFCFRNNFGFFTYFYCFGLKKIELNYDRKSYKSFDYNDIPYDLNEEVFYTLNTSYFSEKEQPVLREIMNSLDVKLKENNVWLDLANNTKKLLLEKSKQHLYDVDLTFKLIKKQIFTPLNHKEMNAFVRIDNISLVANELGTYSISFSTNIDWIDLVLESSNDTIIWGFITGISRFSSDISQSFIFGNTESSRFYRLRVTYDKKSYYSPSFKLF
ncbi:hypothetical protein [Flavobacterium columnare]|uniref:Uncharacterized protein n=1 Tax=Flavobacterium columnare (strain ATCC 49512 / CIP 103533 / TG 44/87) TaxID=1041826 RepID=G8X9D1_FLACA|nr:hypothetical protein [Flavobacterium columnare]AEW85878.1 hypothetical protein FCOL_05265 [Flavobacterium columnare ATCC 49512]